jgi:uncharacterized membrane protein YfcA
MSRRILASLSGLLTGIAAGFIGVGGGEFRIPVLVRILKFPIKVASGVNLFVGLFTVALSVYRRWGRTALTGEDVTLVAVMGIASLLGAALGVVWRKQFPIRPLTLVVRTYLIVVGVWMLYESFTQAEHALMNPDGIGRWLLAAVVAFAIAAVSGILGVAGGEMRIPALLYLFGLSIVEAGTLSLMVSIPTLAAGAATDRRLGGLPNSVLRVALLIGLASAVGVLIGVALIPYADRHIIKAALGIVLLLSATRLHEPREPTVRAD